MIGCLQFTAFTAVALVEAWMLGLFECDHAEHRFRNWWRT